MPYIDAVDREYIDEHLSHYIDSFFSSREEDSPGIEIKDIADILSSVPSCKIKGAFNYFVSRLWMNTFFPDGKIGYTGLSDAIAVFEDMHAETRRRLMDPYENECITKNGDVPEFEGIMMRHKKSDKLGLREK